MEERNSGLRGQILKPKKHPPDLRPERADLKPERADLRSRRTDNISDRVDFRHGRKNFRSERVDFVPERADSRLKRADCRPEMANFSLWRPNREQMNRWTNEQKTPNVLQIIVSFRATAQKTKFSDFCHF